jgi:murein L,D-transpeptidase YafK
MAVYCKGKKMKTYIISLGTQPVGRKICQGDLKTPEGKYIINDKNPQSIYHKNLGISYPNNDDRQYARTHKLQTGGDVKIHGLPNNPKYEPEAYLNTDWTWGCIAVSNEEIDELYKNVKMGSVICIFP